ncbi:DCL family protein [Oceanobacter antarcticus]|uniref:DCL family protein n=1 Tax=Oceanobacter antarcticus TaxID=3133425 RepID=A0ABW8NLK6_9GAMM
MGRAKSMEISGIRFKKKGDVLLYLKEMLNKYRLEEQVSVDDAVFLSAALLNHPDAKEKIGLGVSHFFVRSADYGTKCFWIERIDGTQERFSYKSCVC